MLPLVTLCYHLLQLVTYVTLVTPCYPKLPLDRIGYDKYFIINRAATDTCVYNDNKDFRAIITEVYFCKIYTTIKQGYIQRVYLFRGSDHIRINPLLRFLPLATLCYPLLHFVTLVTPCYPLLPFATPCYNLLPMLPLLPLVTLCHPLLPLLPFVTPCYPCYPLLPLVTPCYTSYPGYP